MSDVDILFLQDRNTVDKEVEEIIRQTLLALWDIGFKVGHATRSISEAVDKCNDDPITKTSMLECRYLAGEREIFTRFKERFHDECVRRPCRRIHRLALGEPGRAATEIRSNRFHAGAEHQERHGQPARLPKPALDFAVQALA
jgi:UTP:GlnB (protein PII) uridylyltransferase